MADLEDGYARLSNMLIEAYSGADLTKHRAKCCLPFCVKPMGGINQWTESPIVNLAQITRLPRQKVNEGQVRLITMKVILQQKASISGLTKKEHLRMVHPSGERCSLQMRDTLKRGKIT